MATRLASLDQGVSFLIDKRQEFGSHPEAHFMTRGRDIVLDEFGPMFRDPATTLTLDGFKRFLQFRHNYHWTGLDRQIPNLTWDYAKLKLALTKLVDESRPVGERLDEICAEVRGMGMGIATPILFVAYPAKYGVWNAKTEAGLKRLSLWPAPLRGTDGEKYEIVNARLQWVRDEFNKQVPGATLDTWAMDAFWHIMKLWDQKGELDKMLEASFGDPALAS